MYKIVKCIYCRKFQLTQTNTNFRCLFCLKSKVIKRMRIYYESEDFRLANEVLKKIKEEIQKDDGIDVDFKDASQ